MSLKSTSTISCVLALWIGSATGAVYAQSDVRSQTELYYRRAEAALRAKHPEEAANDFKAIIQLDPKSAKAYANLGVIAYQQGSYIEANQYFTDALRYDSSLWDAKAFLGLGKIRIGQVQEGNALVEASFPHITNPAVKVDSGLALIRAHETSKSLGDVLNVIREILELRPDDPEVLYVAYRAYSDLAAQSLSMLYQKAPNSGQLHQILAQAAMTQDDFPGAIAEYRKAVEADPHLPGIHYELGRAILMNAQDGAAREQAKQEFDTELTSNPMDSGSEYELGEIYRLDSDLQTAEKHYERAVELRPDFVDAQIALGNVVGSEGRPQEAIAHYLEAARLDPDNELPHYRLSQVYRGLGRKDEANAQLMLFQRLRQQHAPSQPISGQEGGNEVPR